MKVCVLAIALASFVSAPAAGAGVDTTRPGFIHEVKVKLRDNKITLSQAHFLRGSEARFVILNVGDHPARFKAGFITTKVLKPGDRAIVYMHLGLRGKFALEQWRAGQRVAEVFIHVQ
jgi:hypothetical protein